MIRFIYNGFITTSNRKDYVGKFLNLIYGFIRKCLLIFSDPLVKYKLWNYEIYIPLSHNLPIVLFSSKNYNTNLGRISNYIAEKYSKLSIIDIGANVGDTVALLRSFNNTQLLCIEGEKPYFELLKKNTNQFTDVTCVNFFLGEKNDEINATVKVDRGTSKLAFDDINKVDIKTLDSVLENFKEFQNSKLIKIDTDGYDFKILKGSHTLLLNSRPVIFVEFDPNLMRANGEDIFSLFAFFTEYQYENIIFYDNFGKYVISLQLDEKEKLFDLSNYFESSDSEKFCDVCVFHAQDKDLFELTRKNELDFFSKNR